jgi:hypothetical protein
MVNVQTEQDFEIILIDNESEDETIEHAESHGIEQIISISEYRPGYALNQGFKTAKGKFGVCLSGHCIPKNEYWLEKLIRNFDDNQVAGVYGRQIPLSYTPRLDKRDLMMTFGTERRVQTADYFFHNANSAVRIDCWENTPFDAHVSNLEDRIWAKLIIEQNYHLVYEPEATVFHPHGIHHNMAPERAQKVVSVLEQIESSADINDLPTTLRPEYIDVAAVCPIWKDVPEQALLESLVSDLLDSAYTNSIYIVANLPSVTQIQGVEIINRPSWLDTHKKDLTDVLQFALEEIEQSYDPPDAVLYANCLFPERPPNFFDELIHKYQYDGLDTIFAGFEDYSNYWHKNNGRFETVGDDLKSRDVKNPVYRALYGLGTVTHPSCIREHQLIGEDVGIIPLSSSRYTKKIPPSEKS